MRFSASSVQVDIGMHLKLMSSWLQAKFAILCSQLFERFQEGDHVTVV